MQIGDTRVGGVRNVLQIATSVTLRHVFVNFRHRMEWLVDVANVVDHESEGKAPLIADVTETTLDLLNIRRVVYGLISTQESSQVGQGIDHSLCGRVEIRIV